MAGLKSESRFFGLKANFSVGAFHNRVLIRDTKLQMGNVSNFDIVHKGNKSFIELIIQILNLSEENHNRETFQQGKSNKNPSLRLLKKKLKKNPLCYVFLRPPSLNITQHH